MDTGLAADYVVVGAGSAGCVLADRLSADGRSSVVVLEAGGDDRPFHNPRQFWSNVLIQTPVGFGKTLHDRRVNWMYQTEPDPGSAGRRHFWPKGKVLGGSSSINGLLYVRGQQADYDTWRQRGCEGWSAENVLPYFRRAEHQERGEDEWHGSGGPLHISDITTRHTVSEALVDACAEAGIPRVADINAEHQEGATFFQLNIKNGRRHSAAVAYLHGAMKRANVTVITHALATRILFDGRRATGVEILQHGVKRTVRAGCEVLLAAGSVASPMLLETSGIGQAERLRGWDIPVVADLANVGENLQDHYMIGLQWRLRTGHGTVNETRHGMQLLRQIGRYALRRTGLLSLAVAQVVAFARSRPGLDVPDTQLHMMPASVDWRRLASEQVFDLEREPGLSINPCQLRPESRGSIHITSGEGTGPPSIKPNYLSTLVDQRAAIAGIKLARKVAAQPALQPYILFEDTPGPAVGTEDEMLDYARVAGTTLYHPVGTCRMGSDDGAVVDPRLRVRGVASLRVVDASVMPTIVSGNTNAATIMIGEKAADLILGDR